MWKRTAACWVIVCLVLCLTANAEIREWTDSTGKFRTRAEFVSLKNGKVTLRQPNSDKTVTLPLGKLSDADQDYVEELMQRMEDEAAEREANEKAAADRESEQDASDDNPPEDAEEDEQDTVARERAERDGRRNTPSSAAAPANAAGRATPTVSLVRPKPNNVISSVRGAIYRTQSINSMRQIALGMIAYESRNRTYPPAAIYTKDGKPGLSWRVAILPMIDQNNLYRRFKLDEPWDSDHNKALVRQMPEIFKSPGSDLDGGFTNYLAVVGEGTLVSATNRGTAMRQVRDGTSNTIMLVEVDDAYAVEWTKPQDYVWDKQQPSYGLGGIWSGQFLGALGDGSVKLIPLPNTADDLNGLFSAGGGELVRVP